MAVAFNQEGARASHLIASKGGIEEPPFVRKTHRCYNEVRRTQGAGRRDTGCNCPNQHEKAPESRI